MAIDPGSIASALTALNTAKDIGSALLQMRDHIKVQDKVMDLNRAIIEAQSHAISAKETETSLRDEIRELKRKIADFELWAATAENYELKELNPGSFAYTPKVTVTGGEPMHYLCATCFNDRKRVILQGQTQGYGSRYLHCPKCGTKVCHSIGPTPEIFR